MIYNLYYTVLAISDFSVVGHVLYMQDCLLCWLKLFITVICFWNGSITSKIIRRNDELGTAEVT